MQNQDNIYARQLANVADFAFDDSVADVFPDMIRRSVPGYLSIITLLRTFAERYAQPGSNLYDLGCSLGAATLSMRHGIRVPDCRIIAIDNSEAMIGRCRKIIERDHSATPVDIRQGDIREIPIENASMVVLNFTLQFIPPPERAALISKTYKGLLPGGIVVLSEKIRFEDRHLDEEMTDIHHAFKKANGYSDLEISQKRSAIENVLIPETPAAHRARFTEAGFRSCDIWFQCFNFTSMIAVK